MKQVVLLLAALAAAPAFAQNAYVSGSAGTAKHTASFEGEKGSENKAGATVAVGYNFTPRVSIEAGYAAFGTVTVRDSGDSVSFKSDAIYGAVVGTYPVSPNVSLIAKLGVARGNTKVSVDIGTVSGSVKENKTGAMFGIGGVYAVTPALAFVTEYQYFGKTLDRDGASLKASLVSIGARYSF